jgi:hypothetical protein
MLYIIQYPYAMEMDQVRSTTAVTDQPGLTNTSFNVQTIQKPHFPIFLEIQEDSIKNYPYYRTRITALQKIDGHSCRVSTQYIARSSSLSRSSFDGWDRYEPIEMLYSPSGARQGQAKYKIWNCPIKRGRQQNWKDFQVCFRNHGV